jgi:hypothetical protein
MKYGQVKERSSGVSAYKQTRVKSVVHNASTIPQCALCLNVLPMQRREASCVVREEYFSPGEVFLVLNYVIKRCAMKLHHS